MEILHRCSAGLDVHKKSITACVRRISDDGTIVTESRTFSTMTGSLLMLTDWLLAQGVTHVAMESTGVYWKPVYQILEGQFDELLLVNAQHIKRVPGRKTDVQDAEWIAQLLQYGLLSPSFVPPPPIRELRDLTRQRTQLIRNRVTVANRVQKVLEDCNIKLASVASDVLGVSGRAMLRAMIAGEDDPATLAELARKRLRGKIPQLRLALQGRITEHHRFLLRQLLTQYEQLEGLIAAYDERIAVAMEPFAAEARRLETIPGISVQAAEIIIAEIGPDMNQFPSAGHLASWVGVCPGNDQSAGKRRSGRTTKGDQWLRTLLVQAAWAAAHSRRTLLGAVFSRLVKRLGKKKALVAVAHKLLRIVYRLLKDGRDYEERLEVRQAS
jgi:transposase